MKINMIFKWAKDETATYKKDIEMAKQKSSFSFPGYSKAQLVISRQLRISPEGPR